jgi:6-phosphogluconolactonase
MSGLELRVFPTVADTMKACATAMAEALREAKEPQVVLAGGQTPRAVYVILATAGEESAAPHWHDAEYWFGDERCVGPDHPKSNYRLAQETLLKPLGIAAGRVHRMLGELGGEEGARRYHERLLERLGQQPPFTLALVGMGPEGHTLSLFPGSPGLAAADLAIATYVPTPPRERISLTPAALSGTARIFFLVTGAAKRRALHAALAAEAPDPRIPTSFLRGRLETVVFCDREAVSDESTEVVS